MTDRTQKHVSFELGNPVTREEMEREGLLQPGENTPPVPEPVPFWRRAAITQVDLILLQRELRELRQALSQVDPWILGDSGCVCQFCGKPMTYCDQPNPETDHDSRCVWVRAYLETRND